VTRTETLLLRPLPPEWSVSWPWFVMQLAFAIYVVYTLAHLPAPGVAISVLGLLAFLATFEESTSKPQRLIWILIATGLLVTEKNVIYADRLENQGEQADARAVDQTRFTKTAKALRTAIADEETQTTKEQTQFQDEHLQFKETLSRFNDLVNTETGGNSFFYLSFTELYGGRTFDIKAIRVGKYPIKAPWVIIDNMVKGVVFLNSYPKSPTPRTREEGARLFDAQITAERTPIKLSDFATKTLSVGPYPIAAPQSDYQQYEISLGANNGNWIEEILMKKLPGPYLGEPPNPQNHHWSQATTVTGDGIKNTFHEYRS
jgi:hypothetical protein